MHDLNHHLWLNRRGWWVAFTVTYDGHRQERIRRSLGTRNVEEARIRRDRMMEEYGQLPNCELSIRVSTRTRRPTPGPANLLPCAESSTSVNPLDR